MTLVGSFAGPVTAMKATPWSPRKQDFMDLFLQDLDSEIGALTKDEERCSLRRLDNIRSRSIIRWIMLDNEKDPQDVRETFYKMPAFVQDQLLSFLSTMQEEMPYEWRLRVHELQLT